MNPVTRATFIAQAQAICQRATHKFLSVGESSQKLESIAAWYEAAARFSEQALAKLRALPSPKGERAHFNRFYALLEQQTDVRRQAAPAASAGETRRAEVLGRKRVTFTHRKGARPRGVPRRSAGVS